MREHFVAAGVVDLLVEFLKNRDYGINMLIILMNLTRPGMYNEYSSVYRGHDYVDKIFNILGRGWMGQERNVTIDFLYHMISPSNDERRLRLIQFFNTADDENNVLLNIGVGLLLFGEGEREIFFDLYRGMNEEGKNKVDQILVARGYCVSEQECRWIPRAYVLHGLVKKAGMLELAGRESSKRPKIEAVPSACSALGEEAEIAALLSDRRLCKKEGKLMASSIAGMVVTYLPKVFRKKQANVFFSSGIPFSGAGSASDAAPAPPDPECAPQ